MKVRGDAGDTRIVIPPQILKCGPLVYASMIVDGDPQPSLRGALADVDLVKFDVSDVGRQTFAGLVRSKPAAFVGVLMGISAVAVAMYGLVLEAGVQNDRERAAQAVAEALANTGRGAYFEDLGAGIGGAARSSTDAHLMYLIRQAVDEALDARGIQSPPPAGSIKPALPPSVPPIVPTPRPTG